MPRTELHGAYEREQVEELLGPYFHGGTQWTREDAPDADMPKAKSNPKLQGTWMAVNIDIDRALRGLLKRRELRNEVFLWRYYAEGWTQKEIADTYGVNKSTVSRSLETDVGRIRDAMNEGQRPGQRGASKCLV